MYYWMNSENIHALWAEFQDPATEVTHLGLNHPTVFSSAVAVLQDQDI